MLGSASPAGRNPLPASIAGLAREPHRIPVPELFPMRAPLLPRNLLLAALMAPFAALAPGPGAGPGAAESRAARSGVSAALERLETAFRRARAEELRPLLAEERKVYLAVPALQPRPGFVGADQAYYLLREFFADHPTREFLVTSKPAAGAGGEATVEARWRFDGGAITLSLTLIEIDGDWYLSALRAADA